MKPHTASATNAVLLHTALALWFLGLALAILLGRAAAYWQATERRLLAPFSWLKQMVHFAVRGAIRVVARAGR